ncbi:MAG TPA: nicotinate-nucleotide--dimethylbenzimidazole phosphoribosyltransferase [Actinomycetota bacterium]
MNALEAMLDELPGPDADSMAAVRARAGSVLRPVGALERLDAVAVWLAGWQRTARPSAGQVSTVVFAADHGVASAGVSAYPVEVTKAMISALDAGVATAAVMSRSLGARLQAIDVGVGEPSGDIRTEAALNPERFDRCVQAGRAAAAAAAVDGTALLVLGEMGIGNTTAAAAVCAAVFGGDAERWTGRGTGVDDAGLARKLEAVTLASERARGLAPLDALRHVGGAELVAIAAAVVEARRRSLPVVLDGFVVCAAVAPLHVAAPGVLDHCIAAHRSAEPGHGALLDRLGLDPLLDLGLRLGEGSGALIAVPIVRLAAASVTDVATFEEWGLS